MKTPHKYPSMDDLKQLVENAVTEAEFIALLPTVLEL